ncbi:MAG: hypothetical protein ACLFM1_05420 [Bacteroidales bacterium]
MNEKKKKRQKFNKPWFGLLIGLTLPLLVVVIFYLTRARSGVSLFQYLDYLVAMGTFLPIFSLATLVNLIPFYILKGYEYWYANRGIVFSIFLYVIVVILLKFA